MKTLVPGLQGHFDEGATTLAQCWKLTTAGETLGFTDHDAPLSFDGVRYEAETGFTGSEMASSLGLQVDNLDVAGALSSSRLSEAKLRAGHYDNAAVEIWLVNWQDVNQRLLLRKGHLGEVSHGDLGFTAEVRGLAHLLNQPKGRLFQHDCDAAVGDRRCGVNLALPQFRGAGAVVSAEDNRRLIVSGLAAFADQWFTRGVLNWTGGANAGRAAQVKAHRKSETQTAVELWAAMSENVSAGDAFSVTAGCGKSFEICKAKFANTANFRGFPHMPGNDFVTSYPNRDDATNDGGSRG
jgi:uncharacterized phage protein (TIGR02218 family)